MKNGLAFEMNSFSMSAVPFRKDTGMRIKSITSGYSESGAIEMNIDTKKLLIGSWTWRITKTRGKKSDVYIVITIWPRSREYAAGFLACLKKYGKESHLLNFVAKRSKLIEQEFEMTYCTRAHSAYATGQCQALMRKVFRSSHFSPLTLAV